MLLKSLTFGSCCCSSPALKQTRASLLVVITWMAVCTSNNTHTHTHWLHFKSLAHMLCVSKPPPEHHINVFTYRKCCRKMRGWVARRKWEEFAYANYLRFPHASTPRFFIDFNLTFNAQTWLHTCVLVHCVRVFSSFWQGIIIKLFGFEPNCVYTTLCFVY